MSDIATLYGGLIGKSKADFGHSGCPYISYRNVFDNMAADLSGKDRVLIGEGERQKAVRQGDLLFTGSSENREEAAMSSVVVDEPSEVTYLNSFSIGARWSDSKLFDPRFTKHLFRSARMRAQLVRTSMGVTRFNVSKEALKKILVPIIPLSVQGEIADVLDDFDALVNDLSSGLPAEIAARRQQYEYYRDRLLTFPEKK